MIRINPLAITLAIVLNLLSVSTVMAQNDRVLLETDRGPIYIELDPQAAPITTENFLNYVNQGFYDGLIFHRVAANPAVVQGGGFDRNYALREPTQPNIINEAMNGLLNLPRTIAMARQAERNSANSQFYFNLVHNDFLDGDFAVFGKVIGGWATVEEMVASTTGVLFAPQPQSTRLTRFEDTPVTPPQIKRAFQFDDYPIQAVHAGSWFDPNNSGVGFNIEVTNQASEDDQPIIVMYWYDFSQGSQIWLQGNNGFEWGDSEVTVELLGVVNPNLQADFQMPPPRADYQTRGEITIRFENCQTGVFRYDVPGIGIGEIETVRLTLPDNSSCDRYEIDD